MEVNLPKVLRDSLFWEHYKASRSILISSRYLEESLDEAISSRKVQMCLRMSTSISPDKKGHMAITYAVHVTTPGKIPQGNIEPKTGALNPRHV